MKKIELLSPVGGYEQFIAAVECGADAVYLGGSSFNARNSAANFSDEELKEAVKYAHIRGVKVHLTLNILIHDREINDAIDLAKRAYSYGVDAFIVQDLGVVNLLRKVIPDAKLHFSTQGTIYSLEGIKALKAFNFERVVLSRELTLDDIENICKNTDTEIEIFVHGALCICYSGQCRLSSLVGERSGNRGKCAQPCRLKYSLLEGDKKINSEYILSPKDLCGIHDLVRIIKSGVTSLKIEGRLKSPEYVACVTGIYRKYIDVAYKLIEKGEEDKYKVEEEDIKKLAQVFNRGGFSRGYYYGESSRTLMCYKRPKHWGTYLGKVIGYDKKRKLVKVKLSDNLNMGDGIEIVNDSLPGNVVTYIEKDKKQVKHAQKGEIVFVGDISGNVKNEDEVYKISDKLLNTELRSFINGKFYKKLPIDMNLSANIGKNLILTVKDNDGNEVTDKSDYIVQEASNRPLSIENARLALSKLGDTPFLLNKLETSIDEQALVPISVLNDIRRNASNLLLQKRAIVDNKLPYDTNFHNINFPEKKVDSKISAYLYNVDNLDGLELADRIYVPIDKYSEELCAKFYNKEVIPYLITVTKGHEYGKIHTDSILVSNIEHLEIFKEIKNKYCDFSFNIFNSYTCKALKDMYNIKGINLSFELNLEEIKRVKTDAETEVTVYGRLPLMISEHCAVGANICGKNNCNMCKKSQFFLEDRVGEKFPIITDREKCRMQILNSKILFASEIKKELEGKVDYFRAYFFNEGTEERKKVLKAIKNGEKVVSGKYTSGHFYRGV